jgi:hypothetical protein
MTRVLEEGDERAVGMDPATPRGDGGGAEGHPTDLEGRGRKEEKGEG